MSRKVLLAGERVGRLVFVTTYIRHPGTTRSDCEAGKGRNYMEQRATYPPDDRQLRLVARDHIKTGCH